MTPIFGHFITIETISPSVPHHFLLKNGIGGVFLPVGQGFSAGVVVEDVEGAPEEDAFKERTSAHNYILSVSLILYINTDHLLVSMLLLGLLSSDFIKSSEKSYPETCSPKDFLLSSSKILLSM